MYHVDFTPSAYRQFAKLPLGATRRLTPHIDALAADPRPPGAISLAGPADLMRIRVGVHRIVYAIEDDRLLVLVVKVGHRRDVSHGL